MGKSQKTYMSIKSKLVAAVAMLLVASFMVVSSTYAWFTLSTAPEVTGIKTTIGSNGSLEIALAYGKTGAEFEASLVDSKVGDSGNNAAWGNIVNVGDEQYGMSTLKSGILPSRLNVNFVGEEAYVKNTPLKTPVYGSDGRIQELEEKTIYGIYDETAKSFEHDENGSGVRVIGTASGMTQQELDYRNAKYAISTSLAQAKTWATQSMSVKGPELASMVATYATSGDAVTYDVRPISDVLTMLGKAADSIETAIKNYYLAVAASKLPESVYTVGIGVVSSKSVAELVGGLTVEGQELPAAAGAVADAYDKLTAIRGDLATAQSNYDAIGGSVDGDKTQASASEMIATLKPIMDINQVTINDLPVAEIKSDISKLASSYIDKGGVFVALLAGSGIYADIAELTGNYSAAIKITEIDTGTSLGKLTNVAATLKTNINGAPTINITAGFDTAFPAPIGSSTNTTITDYYGYALDLVFRTNAVGSNLMLQTDPEQRIYSDSTNTDTLGGGSTMTFTFAEGLTTEQQKSLLDAIRIVFTQKDANGMKIVAVAGLDTEALQITGEGIIANIRLTNYTIDADGLIEFADGNELPKFKEKSDQALFALSQNQAAELSTLIYLDGDKVTNADVVANVANSLTGTLNLQFSSDAELVPMEYTPLHQKDTNTPVTPDDDDQGNDDQGDGNG